jgi:hypothetical protein
MVSGLTRRGDLRIGARVACALLLCATLSACALHWPHWPWKHGPKPAPVPVHAVSIANPWDASIAQYWDRNALKLDLTGLSGEGKAIVTPVASNGWPIRLEFSVRPGSFTRLEVLGAQRLVYDVPERGHIAVFKLDPSAIAPSTPSITLRWSVAADSEH